MLYFDTSFLVPILFQEPTSARVTAFVGRKRDDSLAVSHWTMLEFCSVLAREVRMQRLAIGAAREANARFETLIAASFVVLLPTPADYDLSRGYLQRYETGLRAGDAFHLAIAKNHGASMLHSLDKGLVSAASVLQIRQRRTSKGCRSNPEIKLPNQIVVVELVG